MDPVVVDSNVIIAQLSLVEALSVAIVGGVFGLAMKRLDRKREKDREADLEYRQRREAQEAERQERDTALYGVVLSTARGTEVLLHQAHGDHLNGDVDHSLESIEGAISEFNKVSNRHMARL